ncbi:hypothetical protein [Mycobacterium sp. 155]|uniref:hypothetical protein n=1 Tax=Mycobacterium sp. 155 TaxID=1157943 RepID=UPI0003622BD1|nr:hypothetical protein [Mycobacterium sp. 155]
MGISDDITTSPTSRRGSASLHGLAGDQGPAEGGPAEQFERRASDPSDDDGSAGGEGAAEQFETAYDYSDDDDADSSTEGEGPADGGSNPTTTSTTGDANPTGGRGSASLHGLAGDQGPAEGGPAEQFERRASDASD